MNRHTLPLLAIALSLAACATFPGPTDKHETSAAMATHSYNTNASGGSYTNLLLLPNNTWELWLLGLRGSRLTESGNYQKTGEVLSLYRANAGPLTYTIQQKDGYEYAIEPSQLNTPLAPDGPILYRRLAPAPTPPPAFLSN